MMTNGCINKCKEWRFIHINNTFSEQKIVICSASNKKNKWLVFPRWRHLQSSAIREISYQKQTYTIQTYGSIKYDGRNEGKTVSDGTKLKQCVFHWKDFVSVKKWSHELESITASKKESMPSLHCPPFPFSSPPWTPPSPCHMCSTPI